MTNEKKGNQPPPRSAWLELLVVLPQLMQVLLGLGQAGLIRGCAGIVFLFAVLMPCAGAGIWMLYGIDGLVPAIAIPVFGVALAGMAVWLWKVGGDVRDVEILEEIVDKYSQPAPAQRSTERVLPEDNSRVLPSGQDIDGEYEVRSAADDTEI